MPTSRGCRQERPREDNGRAAGRRRTRVAGAFGKVIFGGTLTRQNYDTTRNVTECSYYDSRADYTFTKTWAGKVECPGGAIH